MAAAGWYPDPNDPGMFRWRDGAQWTDDRLPMTPPPGGASGGTVGTAPPPAMPRLRADGSVKGPSRRASLAVLLAGLAMMIAGVGVLVPNFFEAIDGPRFSIPGELTVELEAGSWVLYERTVPGSETNFGGGGSVFDDNDGATLQPEQVTVTGPGPVVVGSRSSSTTETITRGDAVFTDAVHFDIEQAGEYTISVRGEPSIGGELLVARPVFHLFRLWPWFVVCLIGGGLTIAGIVMWLIGAANRRTARRVGISV